MDPRQPHLSLRFWGVRGSVPAPGPETARYGGNTSCVTLELPAHLAHAGGQAGASDIARPGQPGQPGPPRRAVEDVSDGAGAPALFIMDAGTGIRLLGIALMREKRLPITAHLFLSHTHWDHIQGFPFFAPAFVPGNRILVHGGAGTDDELATVLTGQMLHRYFPVSLSELGSEIRFQHTDPGVHRIAGARITVAELHHPGSAVGYRFEVGGRVIAYCTDTEPYPDPDGPEGPAHPPVDRNVLHLARGADVLIHDAQYTDAEYVTKVGWGHSPLSYAVRTAIEAGVGRLLLFHHDPTRTDDEVDALVDAARAQVRQAGAALMVDAAAEGMEIPLPLQTPVPA